MRRLRACARVVRVLRSKPLVPRRLRHAGDSSTSPQQSGPGLPHYRQITLARCGSVLGSALTRDASGESGGGALAPQPEQPGAVEQNTSGRTNPDRIILEHLGVLTQHAGGRWLGRGTRANDRGGEKELLQPARQEDAVHRGGTGAACGDSVSVCCREKRSVVGGLMCVVFRASGVALHWFGREARAS